jgi:Tfp pilus assembly protein PilF
MMYAKQRQYPQALQALAKAEKIDPRFEMTYVYRGNIYALAGDRGAAAREYRRALAMNPENQVARDALARVSR